ncbi:hypothetical protein F2P81_000618 [Scophthalmus maximus]|uniref:Uncharacterized protein n=1 Tax=Scophthalmus maximus TaxID=52904 RepID=A0A6A4TNW2_SCOMX|nr:hypothetical protein F2P81_000618 [Scophthalmus maximus]
MENHPGLYGGLGAVLSHTVTRRKKSTGDQKQKTKQNPFYSCFSIVTALGTVRAPRAPWRLRWAGVALQPPQRRVMAQRAICGPTEASQKRSDNVM